MGYRNLLLKNRDGFFNTGLNRCSVALCTFNPYMLAVGTKFDLSQVGSIKLQLFLTVSLYW